ncbi:MAG: NAD(P)H-dependent glycerol-3-phosphate dehydrogenase [Clostridia bacterium]|nr:NAD(P)H-dependent glycerol-3-phosphate dehydrogenase [Clostridia bacterium]
MNVTVIGCGRWGSLIAWYLDSIGHCVTLYGREGSAHFQAFLNTRSNGLLTMPESVTLSSDLKTACEHAETLILSVPSQGLRALMGELSVLELRNKNYVLCMKGIEIESGKRLSEIAEELTHPSNRVAVWLGPGHVQEFYAGVPNCMVIDSRHEELKQNLVDAFSGKLIRFYYGQDLIGNEIGGATKNVIGIAAGMLDGLKLGTLKGALMSRGTHEIARLIGAMGGNPFSAYGLCHLGDYEATVFSPYSHNRKFGECVITGEPYDALAEGYYTVAALKTLEARYGVELPICDAVWNVIYGKKDPTDEIEVLFSRTIKPEIDGKGEGK